MREETIKQNKIMETLILFSIAAICITAVAITFVICFFRHLSSTGFVFQQKVIKDIKELQSRLQNDFMTYNALRETITEMQNKIKELTGEPNF